MLLSRWGTGLVKARAGLLQQARYIGIIPCAPDRKTGNLLDEPAAEKENAKGMGTFTGSLEAPGPLGSRTGALYSGRASKTADVNVINLADQALLSPKLEFIDLFAGCGGLSLGLLNAGCVGRFAIEKHPDAFGTFAENLISGPRYFNWPEWLPQQAITTGEFLELYAGEVRKLRGKVDLIAGGPPCQGFSLAGRRVHSDPRNRLTEDYLKLVGLVKPRFLLIENVQGFDLPFKNVSNGEPSEAHSLIVKRCLEAIGYRVFARLIDLSMFGLPQRRKRFIILSIREGDPALTLLGQNDPIDLLLANAPWFRRSKGLRANGLITTAEAISDLTTVGKQLVTNADSGLSGFSELAYIQPPKVSRYQSMMRKDALGAPNSMRLANHSSRVSERFQEIVSTCTPGRSLSDLDRRRLKLKKHALTVLAGDQPASTVTTLPDDIIHYEEPRILTVRENARLQSFPDWFKFTGKYTSGGGLRKNDCPRYSQVGNAVPPLFAEAVGLLFRALAGAAR